MYKVHVRLHEKGDLERGVEEQDMIKDEVGVELYILNCRAEYNQVWGRSRTILNCSAGYDQEWGRSRTIYIEL